MTREIEDIRARYSRRKILPESLYDPINPWVYMMAQEKERALIRWIRHTSFPSVKYLRVLEIGCGSGTNLIQFMKLGFLPENLVGNELLEERAAAARRVLPASIKIFIGDASVLELEEKSFDVVFQSTVFSSILDKTFRHKLAGHIWTFVKPGGGILWYDFIYNNPRNADVKGIKTSEIRELFPEGEVKTWHITLAPPLGRGVTRVHPILYTFFNAFSILRTHVLSWIRKSE
jgi:SAM-dependent methyltransferase